jgi:4-carboxymuconolactone decarboxylase
MIWRSARLDPPATVSDEVAATLEMTAPPGGEPPGTIAVLAHAGELMGPFLGWAAALALNGRLPKRDHEILAMRAAYNCRSAFEWGEHAVFCRRDGLSEDEIAGIATGPDRPGWSARDAALLRAADELHTTSTISEATWGELAATYDAGQLVEVVYVVGQYTMLSMVANGLGISGAPDLDPLPT